MDFCRIYGMIRVVLTNPVTGRKGRYMSNVIDLDIRDSVSMIHFEILTPQVAFGDELSFTFTLQNISEQPVRLDIRYEITHPDRDGRPVRRMYKISNRKCPMGFLLYNHSHTILEDSLPADRRMLGEAVRETMSDRSVSHIAVPCELGIVVNGIRRISGGFLVSL